MLFPFKIIKKQTFKISMTNIFQVLRGNFKVNVRFYWFDGSFFEHSVVKYEFLIEFAGNLHRGVSIQTVKLRTK